MICENCKIYSEMFGPICSVCGSEMEYAPKVEKPQIPCNLPIKILAEKKILTSIEIDKNKVRARSRFLWFFL